MFRLGYNTNGLAHHRVTDALELLAELGYEACALTPDVGQLDPFRASADDVAEVRLRADDLGLALTVETGARYLLDRGRKHFPTLLEDAGADRARRVDFLERCVDLAAELGAGVVSLWSGAAPDGSSGDPTEGESVEKNGASEALWERLSEGVAAVLARGRAQGVRIAFEPEPGMFVERPGGFDELRRRLGSEGEDLYLCLDVGHCLCTGDLPVNTVVSRYAPLLGTVHLDDVRDGVHVHRMFGEGDLDLPGTLAALVAAGFDGVAAVELSRDAHRGPDAAREALGYLRAALGARPDFGLRP